MHWSPRAITGAKIFWAKSAATTTFTRFLRERAEQLEISRVTINEVAGLQRRSPSRSRAV
jgi:hypothetical protein